MILMVIIGGSMLLALLGAFKYGAYAFGAWGGLMVALAIINAAYEGRTGEGKRNAKT